MQKINFRSSIYISVHRLSVLTFVIADEALVCMKRLLDLLHLKNQTKKTLSKYLVSLDFCHACFSDCYYFM